MNEEQQDNVQDICQTSVSSSASNLQGHLQDNVQVSASQDETNITTSEKPKEKDPKRVAAGKRLAAISKAAKEKKMRELLEADSSLSWKQYAILVLGSGFLSYVVYRRFFSKDLRQIKEEPDEIKSLDDLKPVRKTMSSKKIPSRGKPISMFD